MGVLVATKKKVCEICRADIPNKSRDALVDMGYSMLELGSGNSPNHKYMVFCPNHSSNEVADHLAATCKEIFGKPKERKLNKV